MSVLKKRWIGGLVAVAAVSIASPVQAQGGRVDRTLFGGDFSFNGLVRLETAISTSSQASTVNQYGDPANGVAINRIAGNPVGGYTTPLPSAGISLDLGPLGLPGSLDIGGGTAFPATRGVTNNTSTTDTITRYVPSRDNDLNYHILRFEATPSIRWADSGFSLISRIRAVYDPGDLGYRDFDYNDYDDINGGIDGGPKEQFRGKPSHLGYEVEGDKTPLLFERSGRNYMVDLPAFFGQWTNGTVTARLGNQSVAWGQLLFFRLMDVANGLDLRRHLFIDRAIEEFADERMAAPGLRVTVQATDTIVVDSFAQQFVPTVLMNVNTPYNLVPSQFTIRDRYKQGDYDEKINYGFRVKGEFGNYNAQFMYTSRLNPLGSIRWSKTGLNKALPDSNALGAAFNIACAAALIPAFNLAHGTSLGTDNGCGPLLAETPFEASPAGVFSAEEWFNYAGYIKLHGLEGLDRAIDEFPGSQQLLAQPVNGNFTAADNQLDAFFIAGEGLRGHIERRYYREHIFGLGGGFVTEAEPGSIFDQMIINVEATYAKDRKFTAIDLRQDFDERDEVQVGLVVEKYQRFSQSFPATYMVFQYLWQKESDLAGLLLDGYGSENYVSPNNADTVRLNPNVPQSQSPKIAPGLSEGANYVVLAALQPTEAYVFEYSVAALIDVQGGVLVQPAVQWKPRGNITVNLFYNYIEGDAWGGNTNKNLMSLIDFADELGLRVGYQF